MSKTILVADDDVDFLTQLKVQLQTAGFDVISAGGQAEAERLLEETTPDLAILDLMMENQDGGFALCYHIKKRTPEVPVVLVTAVANETGLEFDAGTDEERSWVKADAMLAKPIRFEQLRKEIDRLLGAKKA
jgi:two-component system, OmpR family, response regulator